MSKVVMSLPKGMMKNSLTGGVIALAVYVLEQLLWALLIDREVLPPDAVYPMVCVAAAVASLLGCLWSVVRGGSAAVLPVSAVVAVFLTLTVTVALVSAKSIAVDNGLTGVGLSMAAGGLMAALVGPALTGGKKKDGRRMTRRKKRRM